MNIFTWIWHGITRCPEADLDHTMYGITHCRSCGRVKFISDTLPVIKRMKVSNRTKYM